jgi:hypothetical protein
MCEVLPLSVFELSAQTLSSQALKLLISNAHMRDLRHMWFGFPSQSLSQEVLSVRTAVDLIYASPNECWRLSADNINPAGVVAFCTALISKAGSQPRKRLNLRLPLYPSSVAACAALLQDPKCCVSALDLLSGDLVGSSEEREVGEDERDRDWRPPDQQ